ncbi:MAG: hypothetical protein M1300_11080 [Epsilonproteobacteria bacterium]|nr:hypothetical protein [Campylobacterota bacterium]
MMRKLLFGNPEKIMSILAIVAIIYSVINALIVGRDQMLMSEEGMVGILNFVISFLFTLALDLAATLGGVFALYLLIDIRALLHHMQKRQ